jgi:nickel-dependent lactate racemase
MKTEIIFPYKGIDSLKISTDRLIDIIEPNIVNIDNRPIKEIIQESIRNPVGLGSLHASLRGVNKVLILVDDYTRTTPVDIILPVVIDELKKSGISQQNIAIMVASGTHRVMSKQEKLKKYGKGIVENYKVIDHLWFKEDELIYLGDTKQGTEIWINKIITEFDYIIGIGNIVPHRVSGFSGGAKIVQPGICGNLTTGQTHWLSALFEGEEIIGKIHNPVREEINDVGVKAGLKFIINTVLDGTGRIYKCFSGDPIQAFEEGCKAAREIFGVSIQEQAEIVISDSFPTDSNLWQAAKGIYSGDLILKKAGVLILVTPCPERVSDEHPVINNIGYQPYEKVKEMVNDGVIEDLTLAAHIVHVGRVIKDKGCGILVSPGINKETTEKLGFYWAKNPQDAIELAFSLQGKNANVIVSKNGGEIMPLLEGNKRIV